VLLLGPQVCSVVPVEYSLLYSLWEDTEDKVNTLAELYATSGVYPDTEVNVEIHLAGEPWPVPSMSDKEFIATIKSLRLKAFPMGGHQLDPIVRNGVVLA